MNMYIYKYMEKETRLAACGTLEAAIPNSRRATSPAPWARSSRPAEQPYLPLCVCVLVYSQASRRSELRWWRNRPCRCIYLCYQLR